MKKIYLALCLSIFTLGAFAQKVTTYNKNGYTLNFSCNDATLDTAVQRRMINTFFEVYPKLANEYNKETLKSVNIVIDTAYKGVAATGNGRVAVNPDWMRKHPEDIDVVTHEVMHIVQNYGSGPGGGPGWLTEGIADFARNQFGVNNPAAKWSLTAFKPTQSYKNSYRITARFLFWIEKTHKKGLVVILDKAMRDHTYTDGIWAAQTGKSLDELWAEYATNPSIT